jgi:malonyl-CoA/methylmalonyl-CoA synthetase
MQAIHQAPILDQMMSYRSAVAITDNNGEYTYSEIISGAQRIATSLLGDHSDLAEQRVAILATPGYDYTVCLLGVWAAGGIAVPLCIQHPPAEMQYVLDDTKAKYVLVSSEFEDHILKLKITPDQKILLISNAVKTASKPLPDVVVDRRAMILYTSGTTSRPKGVVTTHKNISAQIKSLIDAWGWSSSDRIPLFLPLHHVHGIINVLCCSLWAGATCDVLPKFDAEDVWRRVAEGKLTTLMAVPTIYVKLIAAWNDMDEDQKKDCSKAAAKFRLMVSGSAALPVSVLETWETIAGQTLLERYGMTEIGMALSNPLNGERRPGFVGMPLPGMTAMLADENGAEIEEEGVQGEICVHGDTVFNEYWEREEATEAAFRDGWFLTGDIAVINKGSYRILGRNSVDIIKSGGYKISALEIEEVLRTHPDIQECAVVGIADEEWGERVSAAIVSTNDKPIELAELKEWAGERLAKYKIPSQLLALEELPRNVMGKVTKKTVQKLFEADV